MRISDWSSDVCSSDLGVLVAKNAAQCSGITTFELRDRAADKAILALPDAGVDCGNTPVSCRMRLAFVRPGSTVDVVIFEDSLDILFQCDRSLVAAAITHDEHRRPRPARAGMFLIADPRPLEREVTADEPRVR